MDIKAPTQLEAVFAIVMSLSLLLRFGATTSARALSHYFNCITGRANKSGTLTLTNIETCYNKVFKGAGSTLTKPQMMIIMLI